MPKVRLQPTPLSRHLGWALFTVFILYSQAVAQDDQHYFDSTDSEYQNTFGNDSAQPSGGSSTIEEAKRTGRGYRIGGQGIYAQEAPPDVYTVRPGDTLWTITSNFYGDPHLWPQIWSYNPQITNPHWIFPSDQLRLTPNAGQTQVVSASPSAAKARSATSPRLIASPSGSVILRNMGFLDADALAQVGQIVGSDRERMLLADGDLVYIKYKKGGKAVAGQKLSVFRAMNPRERAPEEKGVLVRVLGTVAIDSYDPAKQMARGYIEDAVDPIERGCKVADVERGFERIVATPSKRSLTVHIIALMRPRQLIAHQDFVFIDAGIDKGIEAGYRFFVIRKGDQWRDSLHKSPEAMGTSVEAPEFQPEDYPKEAVAELQVVKVHKSSAVAFVTRSDIELKLGDVAETMVGH